MCVHSHGRAYLSGQTLYREGQGDGRRVYQTSTDREGEASERLHREPTFRAELALAEGRDKGLDSLEGARVLHTSTEVAVPEGGEGRGVLGALLLPPALNAVQVKREGD